MSTRTAAVKANKMQIPCLRTCSIRLLAHYTTRRTFFNLHIELILSFSLNKCRKAFGLKGVMWGRVIFLVTAPDWSRPLFCWTAEASFFFHSSHRTPHNFFLHFWCVIFPKNRYVVRPDYIMWENRFLLFQVISPSQDLNPSSSSCFGQKVARKRQKVSIHSLGTHRPFVTSPFLREEKERLKLLISVPPFIDFWKKKEPKNTQTEVSSSFLKKQWRL